LVRLAAMVALGTSPGHYHCTVGAALAAGASVDEVIGTMLAVAPVIGISRLVPATIGLALALDYDIDAALASTDSPSTPPAL
jgi:4-carboxymuconolactone decarboxylase